MIIICEPLFAFHRCQPGFSALRQAFVAHEANPADGTLSILSLIHRHSYGLTMLRDHIRELVGIYATYNQLPRLGDGLVRSLIEIDAEIFSEKALYAWRDIWLEEGAGYWLFRT